MRAGGVASRSDEPLRPLGDESKVGKDETQKREQSSDVMEVQGDFVECGGEIEVCELEGEEGDITHGGMM